MNRQRVVIFVAEAIPGYIYINIYHCANNHGKYGNGLYNSMIDDKDGPIPSPLIIFTSTVLPDVLLEWHTNKGVHLKDSK
jgi:hypothetical protein